MFDWFKKRKARKVEQQQVPSVQEVCGRCGRVFPDRAHYLDHKCPQAGFRTPRDYRFALRR